mgnify:CR=1 FL=1
MAHYYLVSAKKWDGKHLVFWKQNKHGYTTDLNKAGMFSESSGALDRFPRIETRQQFLDNFRQAKESSFAIPCVKINSICGPARIVIDPIFEPDSITCPRCEKVSYHAGNIGNEYCSACNQFHWVMATESLIAKAGAQNG